MAKKILDMRLSEDEGIWLDQCCIDQSNEEEKTIAVASMDILYSCARWKLILLEDVKLSKIEEEIALKALTRLRNPILELRHRSLWDVEKDEPALMAGIFKKIARARWFERLWCFHEFRVGTPWYDSVHENHPWVLVYGEDGEDGEANVVALPVLLVHMFSQEQPTHAFRPWKQEEWMRRWLGFIQPNASSSWLSEGERKGYNFLSDHWQALVPLECSQARDRIQIACNLCRIPASFLGSLRNNEECHWIYVALTIAVGELGHLALSGPALQLWDGETGLYSWVSHNQVLSNQLRRPFRKIGSGIASISPSYIELDLLLFEILPQKPSTEVLLLATQVLDHDILMRKSDWGHYYLDIESTQQKQFFEALNEVWAESLPPGLLRESLHQVLACALDCGLEWIKNIMEVLRESIVKEQSFGPFTQDEQLFKATCCLLDGLSPLVTKSYASLNENYFEDVLSFLAFLTDERFRTVMNWGRKSAWVQCGSEKQKAVLPGVDARYFLAVPACLGDRSYVSIDRLWILERFISESGQQDAEPRSRWRIKDKARLMVSQDIVAVQGVVRLARNKRVFGKS